MSDLCSFKETKVRNGECIKNALNKMKKGAKGI